MFGERRAVVIGLSTSGPIMSLWAWILFGPVDIRHLAMKLVIGFAAGYVAARLTLRGARVGTPLSLAAGTLLLVSAMYPANASPTGLVHVHSAGPIVNVFSLLFFAPTFAPFPLQLWLARPRPPVPAPAACLVESAFHGELPTVLEWLQRGTDVDATGEFEPEDAWKREFSPLLAAVWVGNANIVSLLLERGANPNREDIAGVGSALHIARRQPECAAIVRLLLARGAKSFIREPQGVPDCD